MPLVDTTFVIGPFNLAWINKYGFDLIPSLVQHACTRVRAYTEERERENIYARVYTGRLAKWESIKGAPFSRAISLPHRWRDRCHEERKTLFRGEGGGEGSCFCSSTIEEPHLPGNRQIIRVKRWSFARDRAAIEFQWRTVLNGWLSDALDQRRYCDFDTRCCFCLIFERLREMTRPLSRQVFVYYLSAYSEKE